MNNTIYMDAMNSIFKNGSASKIEYPHSDVFYIHALSVRDGHDFTLERIEDAMRLEGWRD